MSTLVAFVGGIVCAALALPLVQRGLRWRLRNRSGGLSEASKVNTMGQVLQLAVQGSPSGIAVVSASGRVLLSNARAHDMSIVYDRALHPQVWELARTVFEDQETRTVDIDLPARATGSRIRNVHTVVKPLTLKENAYVIAYSTDESENVRMELARRDFVANVSHELKTPVGAMSLLAEALLQDPQDPEMVEYFGAKLVKESHRMGELITDLIALSKLQGAEALPSMDPVPLDKIVEEAIARNQITAENRAIELLWEGEGNLEVLGDRALLTAAVSNLISNAVNYSPDGQPVSVTQKVAVSSDGFGGDVVLLRVTDRGIGIAPEDQKRVFERFYRVDKARSRSTGGTGLGLAIVKHVVANHGGKISIWSRPGTGSTFTIELPMYDPHASTELGDPTRKE